MQSEPHCTVTCPSCFESFSLPAPAPNELPDQWDYDCEVCCRPMLIHFYLDGDEVFGDADLV